jgi:hypothetical protein
MALGPVIRKAETSVAPVIQVAGDAERFSRPLPASLCRVQRPADKYKRKNTPSASGTMSRNRLPKWGNPTLPAT